MKEKKCYDIDFVIPWVDGSDPVWIEEFNKYVPSDKQIDSRNIRYRDYGLLKYWFRGIEKFSPWVRKVHFITCGQKPDWLNTDCPKLNWVRHSDYIPHDCLPVFSANPIEIYMHRIQNLSEHFVFFNDDIFLTSAVEKDFYFRNGLPCDSAILEVKTSGTLPMLGINFNNLNIINNHFSKKEVLIKNFFKWFNLKYGKSLWQNIDLFPWKKFTGFINPHMPQPFTKTLFEEVWNVCPEPLEKTMENKFRSSFDVNQWLFRHWALCKGDFFPVNPHKGKRCFDLTDSNASDIAGFIKKQTYKEIVINDSELNDFDSAMEKLKDAFEYILPEKSEFEK